MQRCAAAVCLLAAAALAAGQEQRRSEREFGLPRRAGHVQSLSDWTPPAEGREQRLARIQRALERLGLDTTQAPPPESAPSPSALLEVREAARKAETSTSAGGIFSSLAGGLSSLSDILATKRCIMCEYILEVADRNIKSMPHWAHGGDGNTIGMTDYNGGMQQGAYRAYSGQYLQLDEGTSPKVKRGTTFVPGSGLQHETHDSTGAALVETAASSQRRAPPVGSGIPEQGKGGSVAPTTPEHATVSEALQQTGQEADARNQHAVFTLTESQQQANQHGNAPTAGPLGSESHRVRGDPTRFAPQRGPNDLIAQSRLRHTLHKTSASVAAPSSFLQTQAGAGGGPDGIVEDNQPQAAATDPSNGPGMMSLPPRSPMRGRRTFRDFNRLDSLTEKGSEYSQMFDDLMDQFDDICQNDLPKFPSNYKKHCSVLYQNGEYLTELYLHGYEDYEICTRVLACPPNFFDSA